jgi:hypothetical protein
MALCDFYALGDDLRQIFQYLFTETDVVAYESASQPEQPSMQFRSLAEIERAYSLGSYRAGSLQLWSPSVSTQPNINRQNILFPTRTFMHTVNGAGLMQFHLDGREGGIIYHTHFGHWNESGARQRCIYPADDCDWAALARLSRKIQHHIRQRLAVARLYTRPVLRQALEAVDAGDGLWWVSGGTVHADSGELLRATPRVLNE